MSAANNFVSQIFHLAERKGLDGDALLALANIDRAMLDQPERRISSQSLAILVQSLWDHLQDESMGLAAHPIPRGSFYMMGKLAINEPNLGKALAQGARFYGFVTQAFSMQLVLTGEVATLRFDMDNSALDPHHLFAEINLMAWHRFASWLISENLTLNEIFFNYPPPAHAQEYSYLFPGLHRFDAPFQGFSFDARFLTKEISQSSTTLKTFIQQCPHELFIQPQTDFSVSFDLQRLLKKLVATGYPIIEDAASHMNMNKRTLMRKLKEEGTSYQQLKDLVRRDRAIYLLSNSNKPLSEIALEIGFSDPAVFARAFKSWTGIPPRDYRARINEKSS